MAEGKRGAPKGVNPAKNKPYSEAIKRALLAQDGKKLRAIADKIVAMAMGGDMQAIKELGDRVEGKAIQAIDATVSGNLTVEVVRFADTPAE